MKTIAVQLEDAFRAAIQSAFGIETDPLVGVAQNEKFGDYQSNAAMGLAKQITEKTGKKTNPRAVAERIKAEVAPALAEMAEEITIAGPGFINVRLAPAWLATRLGSLAVSERLGIDPIAAPRTVVVDYSGPNVAKQMHVGHLRSTIIGDAIARIMQFQGHHVIRQNHVGDWGTQFGRVVLAMWYAAMAEHAGEIDRLNMLAFSLRKAKDEKDGQAQSRIVQELAETHRRYIRQDPDGTKIFEPYLRRFELPLSELETLYQFVSTATEVPAANEEWVSLESRGNCRLSDLPRLITTFIQNPDDPRNAQEMLAWRQAVRITVSTCDEIYHRLGVQLADEKIQAEPIMRGESFYKDQLAAVVAELKQKGVAVESEGAVVVHVPGFEAPLIIQKSDGSFLYGTTDLAAIRFRAQTLHADAVIYTHDSRQAQHFSQVFWTARQAGWAAGVDLRYAPFGTMLGEDGKPFKTRGGDTVKLKELLDEAEERARIVVDEKNPSLPDEQRRAIAHAVGIGGVKYADLSKDRVSDYMFSWDKMLALDGNTGPYLQYAYARVESIFRKAGTRPSASTAIALAETFELALAKHIVRLGDVIDLAARELKPHHLCAYLYDLASRFSGFYENCPVLSAEEPVRSNRLALCELTARTMALGLDLLGIEHPPQM